MVNRTAGPRTRMIGDVEIAVMERDAALDAILDAVAARRGEIWAFCNAHSVNCARQDAAFRRVLNAITFLNDGIGVDVASRMLHGAPFPANLNGTDLTPLLLERLSPEQGVFLLGSPAGVADRAADALRARFAHLTVVGTHHGFFTPEEEPELAERIVASDASVVLVGMGNPRQEIWAARNVGRIGVPILCIGAFLDFSAGVVRRSPKLFQQLRVEWVYRLAQEPRRLARRYVIGNATFLLATFRQRAGRA